MKLHIDLDIAAAQRDNVHGWHDKDGVTVHETVSPDYRGLKDLIQTSEYLDNKNYGIYAVVDLEGHIAASRGLGRAIFYHTDSSGNKGNGNINTRKIGIELISRVMLDYPDDDRAWKVWVTTRDKQIRAVSKLIACLGRAHEFPLKYQDPQLSGITTHWDCTTKYGVPGGHTDCHPRQKGGYFPVLRIAALSRTYYQMGYRF